ncbi:MAG: DEAD/DEAH box helicase family protein [Clostridiales bacterium]|nr:DEAD/DEAH box helicase family protein [Clostridiales bacterium]
MRKDLPQAEQAKRDSCVTVPEERPDPSYQWQRECLERWLENGGRGMVQAVTGSGKTRLAIRAIDALEQKLGQKVMVKIVVPTSSLMRQWASALRNHQRENRQSQEDGRIGLRGGGRKDPINCKYMIYVVNSARYELARQILAQLESGEAVFLIADECHHYASGENHLIFEFLTRINREEAAYYSLGLSATLPSGMDGRILAESLGPRIYSYGMAKATDRKTICPIDVFHVALTFWPDEMAEYEDLTDKMTRCFDVLRKKAPFLDGLSQRDLFEELRRLSTGMTGASFSSGRRQGAQPSEAQRGGGGNRETGRLARVYLNLSYKRKKLVCLASSRLSCAEALIRLLGQQKRILVFGERIAQAEELYCILNLQYPGRVGRCHSKMGEQANRSSLERFRIGEYRILITCKSMDEGVDIPDASIGIILSGTSGHRQRIQRMGRIVRKKEGKNRASLYYLHIEESVEDACYLPDLGDSRIFELAFDAKTWDFMSDGYEEASWQVEEDLICAGTDEKTMREAYRCLDEGRVRGDWMSTPEELEEQIAAAHTPEERNYWVCMKKVAAARKKRSASFAFTNFWKCRIMRR